MPDQFMQLDKVSSKERVSNKHLSPPIYSWAIKLVVLVVFFQMFSLLSIFWLRHYVFNQVSKKDRLTAANNSFKLPSFLSPKPPALPTIHSKELKKDASFLAEENKEEKLDAYIKDAERFEREGELSLARDALNNAEEVDPLNCDVLVRQAQLAERQKDGQRAYTYWSKIAELDRKSSSSSPLYKTARQKVAAFRSQSKKDSASPPLIHSALKGIQGMGKTLSLEKIRVEKSNLSNTPWGQEVTLRVPIFLSDPSIRIDPKQIRYQIYIYDEIDKGIILQSNAKITSSFENPLPTWTIHQTEILRINYKLERPVQNQRFYGYIIRIFYCGQLQDQIADPPELLTRLPGLTPKM
ncbi:hypothetical protein A946_04785 [Methylacidiphilum kamchatkense Kam1]|uniref:Tetratricopeptide repeat protein n=1 Tax=Methylacidiphilum kamchatkense Kam1 TaxID=1202785 RepID=A0A0C1USH4_9BACT|nr:hypothetical protein [Methylacidiphilum kamchatkense]KIE58743.1 hypothetical protein A946_04785 [Methylacidiphilum kamchatkense Kam1]QDQ41859.1 hypothetical protein kam1_611 [Methylacidiphilum kamchatkense Kam1]